MEQEIKVIADTYGVNNQLVKAKEELKECIEAIDEYSSDVTFDIDVLEHLAEEIADARIMLDQIVYLLELGPKVAYWRAFKLMRQMNRMSEQGDSK